MFAVFTNDKSFDTIPKYEKEILQSRIRILLSSPQLIALSVQFMNLQFDT